MSLPRPACVSSISPRSGCHFQQGVEGADSWGGREERKVLLNATVCSNHCADETAKSWELGICESKLLTGFHGELSKSENWFHQKVSGPDAFLNAQGQIDLLELVVSKFDFSTVRFAFILFYFYNNLLFLKITVAWLIRLGRIKV